MGEIQTFRDLIVWRKAMKLVRCVYHETKGFPKEEMFGLTAQMRRSAVSIPSNIAEGYGRGSTQDYIRFLNVARGSLYELQTQIEISRDLTYLDTEIFNELNDRSREIERMLSSLIKKLSDRR